MGLFDDVISAHAVSGTTAASPASSQSSSGGTSGQGDDSIIIIDDAPVAPAPSVRDSVSFFDATVATEESAMSAVTITEPVVSEGIISFSDEPVVSSVVTPEPVAEVTFLTDEPKVEVVTEVQDLNQLLVQVNSNEEAVTQSVAIEEPTAAASVNNIFDFTSSTPMEEKKEEVFSSSNVVDFIAPSADLFTAPAATATDMFASESVKAEPKTLENPLDILDESIVKLESLNTNHESVKQGKLDEISDINKQIAALKKQSATLGKEVDKINLEQEKVVEMIKLFQSQKAA